MKKHEYGNTVQDNLWDELTKQAHLEGTLDESLSMKDIMDTWTLQKGYPVVQVDRAGDKIKLNQRWFLLNPFSNALQAQNLNEYNKRKWFVPFTYTTRSNGTFSFEARPVWLKPADKDRKHLS